MDSNDLNRRMRYALMLDDADVGELLQLAGFAATAEQIAAWREREGAEGYQPCPPQALNCMLDGLIVKHRGARSDPPATAGGSAGAGGRVNPGGLASAGGPANSGNAPVDDKAVIDNNDMLKKLRIALSLKTDDVHDVIVQGGGKVGNSEVGALFRKPGARNYRRCGDQVLRWFLAGLAARR